MYQITYLILGRIGRRAAKASQLATWSAADETIALQCLVILNVLLELAQGVASRRALCASHERHDGYDMCVVCARELSIDGRLLLLLWLLR